MKTRMQPASGLPRRGVAAGDGLLRRYLHKTSNSLCGIKGYASLIARQAAGTGDEAAWAGKIIREVERMEAVFRAVGDLARPTDAAADADLAEVLDRAADEARRRHPGLEIVRGDVPARRGTLPGGDLLLVLRELLDNAAEGRDGVHGARRVVVELDDEPTGYAVLRLADDGPGLDPDVATHAADPLVTTKADRAGVGLTRVATVLDMYGLAWHLQDGPEGGVLVTFEYAAADTAAADPATERAD